MKSFNDKINDQFSNLKLKVPESAKYMKQYFADYIELVSLVSIDFVSRADIRDRLIDEGENFNVENPNDGENGQIEPQINDKTEGYVNVYFDYIEQRKTIYNTNYPFIIDKGKGIKVCKKDELSYQQKLYIYLLIASSLSSFLKLKHFITNDFEMLSEKALKAYLPIYARVIGFGNNSKYVGNAREKIIKLGKDINVYDIDRRVINLISEKNSKEEGLDIVGWMPFEDNNPNTIIIFGQCACGKDWFGKQIETKRYSKFYRHYNVPFLYAMFYPEDFQNENGLFNIDLDLIDNIVFERRRLINLANENIFESLVHSNQIVERCLVYQEDIV